MTTVWKESGLPVRFTITGIGEHKRGSGVYQASVDAEEACGASYPAFLVPADSSAAAKIRAEKIIHYIEAGMQSTRIETARTSEPDGLDALDRDTLELASAAILDCRDRLRAAVGRPGKTTAALEAVHGVISDHLIDRHD